MEIANNEIKEFGLPASATDQELASLDIVRTETVLSRLPVHNLAKTGKVNIQILKTTPDGKVELKWIVSYSDRYGQARQLAYKLDTIVINQRIDEQGRPLPKMICLGSLRDVADQLDLGGDTNKVRRALRQNASAFITAKFEYRGNDGSKKTLEADFTRYSVVFTGEQLPDGRRADSVYIILNEPYREVLNNAPVRPLDRAYMKTLSPGAQRFYEIISYKIFSAIKNDYPHAKIAYSEYCTFSAQLRHFERQPVQDQMAKIIRRHKESGYITSVKYQSTIDAENNPDWIIYLTPGPKAHTEFAAAHPGRKLKKPSADPVGSENHKRTRSRIGGAQKVPAVEQAPQPTFDPQLVAEFTRRGITEKKASDLLANLKPGQDPVAQIELGESLVRNARIPIANPPGFFVRLIESNMSVPDSFETNAKRRAREENERKERERRIKEDARQQLEWEYDDYSSQETNRFIAGNQATFEAIKDAKRTENRERHQAFSDEMIESIARNEAKREIRKQAPLLTFKEFAERKQQSPDFLLKPVGLPLDAESDPASESDVAFTHSNPVLAAVPTGNAVMTDDVAISPEADPAEEAEEISSELPPMGRGEANRPAGEPVNDTATQPAISELASPEPMIGEKTIPESAIEFVSAPPLPPQDLSGNAADMGIA